MEPQEAAQVGDTGVTKIWVTALGVGEVSFRCPKQLRKRDAEGKLNPWRMVWTSF